MEWQLRYYLKANGRNPFREWLNQQSKAVNARIELRLLRFERGNLGDVKAVGRGIYEARLDFGSGYRIYFGREGTTLLILLCGGNKDSQWKDISKAQQYWKDYLEGIDA